jgi:hypothetical protein
MCYLHPCSFRGNYQFCDIFSAVRLQSLKNNFFVHAHAFLYGQDCCFTQTLVFCQYMFIEGMSVLGYVYATIRSVAFVSSTIQEQAIQKSPFTRLRNEDNSIIS